MGVLVDGELEGRLRGSSSGDTIGVRHLMQCYNDGGRCG